MNSQDIICDCGHPARLHQSGSCGGYVVKHEYEFLRRGTNEVHPFCGCKRNMWQVIDDYISKNTSVGINQSLLLALKEAREMLKIDLDAFGDCDHSVGVCNCDLKEALRQADLAIEEATGLHGVKNDDLQS